MLVAFDWDEHVQITEPKKADDLPLTGLGAFANRQQSVASVSSQKPENVGVAVASNGKDLQIPSEIAKDESLKLAVPDESIVDKGRTTASTEAPNQVLYSKREYAANPSFSLYTLAALAAIVGSITIGWMFLFGPKS